MFCCVNLKMLKQILVFSFAVLMSLEVTRCDTLMVQLLQYDTDWPDCDRFLFTHNKCDPKFNICVDGFCVSVIGEENTNHIDFRRKNTSENTVILNVQPYARESLIIELVDRDDFTGSKHLLTMRYYFDMTSLCYTNGSAVRLEGQYNTSIQVNLSTPVDSLACKRGSISLTTPPVTQAPITPASTTKFGFLRYQPTGYRTSRHINITTPTPTHYKTRWTTATPLSTRYLTSWRTTTPTATRYRTSWFTATPKTTNYRTTTKTPKTNYRTDWFSTTQPTTAYRTNWATSRAPSTSHYRTDWFSTTQPTTAYRTNWATSRAPSTIHYKTSQTTTKTPTTPYRTKWATSRAPSTNRYTTFRLFTSRTRNWFTTEAQRTTQILFEKYIDVNCQESNWYIRLALPPIKATFPDFNPRDVYLGKDGCTGYISGIYLIFSSDYNSCSTVKVISTDKTAYSNTLIYALHDPDHRFIVREYRFKVKVECDMPNTETGNNNIHHNHAANEDHTASGLGHFSIHLKFYGDEGYQHELSGYPPSYMIGDYVYVKVQTSIHDYDIKMRVSECYTKPTQDARDSYIYYLIKNGCPDDQSTTITSQSSHETRFRFQDFEYAGFPDSMYVNCNATFCRADDYSSKCEPVCKHSRRLPVSDEAVEDPEQTISFRKFATDDATIGLLHNGDKAEYSDQTNKDHNSSPTKIGGYVVGGVVVSIAFISAMIVLGFYIRKKKNRTAVKSAYELS